jgi:hypothetical protein
MPPEAGHGALLSMELDPVSSPGVFTTIAQLNSDIPIGATHDSTEITPHNERMSRSQTSKVIKRDPWTFDVNYIHADTTHDGLRDAFYADPPTTFGMKFLGPSGSAGDAIITSGEVISWKLTHPVRSGPRMANVSFQPSGPQSVDGTIIT